MRETAKNYEDRIRNGDFRRYLHGYGIDIGGGNDCLQLPPNIKGKVYLWDFADGDAQYLRKIKDETFDFVYSSHCLEHMRNINIAFLNWMRVCKRGGVMYICVPHELYYEKGIWPSINNLDHKHSFTLDKKSSLVKNVVIVDFLRRYDEYIEIIDIRENLKNYNFKCDKKVDQTADYENMVCAQFDIILRKKKRIRISAKDRVKNSFLCMRDYFVFFLPMRFFCSLPEKVQAVIKGIIKSLRKSMKDKYSSCN